MKKGILGSNSDYSIMFQFGWAAFGIRNKYTSHNNNFIDGNHYEKGVKDINKGKVNFRVEEIEIYKLNF